MRAVRIIGKNKIEIQETSVPTPAAGQALVRPLMVAICGSDLRKIHYLPDTDYPLPPGVSGHEVIGRIEEIVAADTKPEEPPAGTVPAPGDVKAGDIVLALFPEREDAMAEYAVTGIENLLPLPPAVEPEKLLMAQQLGTVVYACRKFPQIAGSDCVVIGQGSAGLFFDAMLRRAGAREVIAVDPSRARLNQGLRMGATAAVDPAEMDPAAFLERRLGTPEAGIVVEACGETEAIRTAARLVAQEGFLFFFGIPHERCFEFDFFSFFRKYCHSTSTAGSTLLPDKSHFTEALKLIGEGTIDLTGMVTHRLPFEEVIRAYRLAYTREEGAVKVVVQMPAYGK